MAMVFPKTGCSGRPIWCEARSAQPARGPGLEQLKFIGVDCLKRNLPFPTDDLEAERVGDTGSFPTRCDLGDPSAGQLCNRAMTSSVPTRAVSEQIRAGIPLPPPPPADCVNHVRALGRLLIDAPLPMRLIGDRKALEAKPWGCCGRKPRSWSAIFLLEALRTRDS